MRFLLDFDGVIFNTFALKEEMTRMGLPESDRSQSTFARIGELNRQFDASAFVFDDARQFIEANAHRCDIVSSFMSIDPQKNVHAEEQRLYQETKILASGITDLVGEAHVHVVGQSKAEMLKRLKQEFDSAGEECLFVDDHLQYIHEAKVLGIRAFWMVRDASLHQESMEALGDVQRISSFTDLNHYK